MFVIHVVRLSEIAMVKAKKRGGGGGGGGVLCSVCWKLNAIVSRFWQRSTVKSLLQRCANAMRPFILFRL